MVAPAPAVSSFSSPPHQEPGGIYLDWPARPNPSRSSPSSISSHSSPDSPQTACSAPHSDRHLQYRHQNLPQPTQLHAWTSPLPSLQHLTLPPIDALTMSAVLSPHPTPDMTTPRVSMTSREWVIPPRPKPGRKPATDTPPTKRKAQNRAAQRAFRERRAARVGELEELLLQQKEEQDKTEGEMKEKIRGLEMEVQSFRSRCLLLESMLERERKDRLRAETDVEALRRRQHDGYPRHDDISTSQNSLPGIGGHQRRSMSAHQGGRQGSLPPILPSLETPDAASPPLTCGNCSSNACACADEAMATVANTYGQNNDLKRPVSPSAHVSDDKRQRPSLVPDLARSNHDQQPPSSEDNMTFKDSCGFCKEGTYCVCADTVMATPAMTPTTDTLPPITHQTQTPPPSEPDASSTSQLAMEVTSDGAVKLPRRSQAPRPAASQNTSRGCGPNGPGSCAQCQADPRSGLFCRLMAAKLSRGQGGCCGGKGADGGCCKTKPKPEKITLPSLPSLGLTCAEAYQTLSSHRNFDKASDDIGSWLPKLRATPTNESSAPTRMPMEVEAASIMSVLKDFDVRFGG